MSVKIGIILQARMGSTRLPGKSMRCLSGRPLIEHVIARLKRCRRASSLILATTERREDDALAACGSTLAIPVFRGDALDVLRRYALCAQNFSLDHVVRATGDNPFVDPVEIDQLIELHISASCDFAESFSGGLPIGIGAEIMTRAALVRANEEGFAPDHREHVDEFILQNPQLFSRATLPAPLGKRAPGLSFTIDTLEEFEAAERLFAGPFHGIDPLEVGTEMLVSGEHTLSRRST